MEVDRAQARVLTEEERTTLRNEKKCFYCKKAGHISKVCQKRLAKEKEREPRNRKTDMLEQIKEMNDDERESLRDQLAMTDLGFV